MTTSHDSRKKVLVIAPHPDDETLGCGGTLLRHVAEGDEVHWLIVTAMSEQAGFPLARIASRKEEIANVAVSYNFRATHQAELPTTALDTLSQVSLVTTIGATIKNVQPDTIYIPYRNDVHSDHAAVFDAAIACSKTFRYPCIQRVYAYETLSETEFGMRTDDPGFRPNLFINISAYQDRKIEIMRLYKGEMGSFPFPRSEECMRAQSMLRGSQAGVCAAEAFMVLKEIR